MRLVLAILTACCSVWLADSIQRWLLRLNRRHRRSAASTLDLERTIAIIPSRSEGAGIASTVASLEGLRSKGMSVGILLDGYDSETGGIAENEGLRMFLKEPPGPTKAAALRWLAEVHRSDLVRFTHILLLDVGSRMANETVELPWIDGAAAVQLPLVGRARDGSAVSASESLAQMEDAARAELGWSSRLRGTGMILETETFLDVAPLLATQTEDRELSVLLPARGERIAIASAPAVFDEKPESVATAGSQRSRWLLGQLQLVPARRQDLGVWLRRSPAEAGSFLVELASRPLSLTILARTLIALVALPLGRLVSAAPRLLALSVASLAIDLLYLSRDRRWRLPEAWKLVLSWCLAAMHLPRALEGWIRARR